ncbi:amino acid--tRNA ligase-related protein [Rhizobium sp. AN95]|uniref:amino acid--tRNA ligase-related protein n=1 Tax=Rhizobium sp. AN95 TaxID=3035216 RepID=UPI002B25BB8B|nr:amino acid--tRNA ligase-related protein [Rhizobium sp. AN95]
MTRSIRKYGSDKPDLRNPIVMEAVTEHFDGSGFKVFANMIASNPKVQVWAIPAKTGGSRAFCDRMNAWAQSQGQPGLGYIFWKEEEGKVAGSGPLAKNIGEERTEALRQQLGLEAGDACFFVAGDPAKFYKFAGEARTRAADELNLIDRDRFEMCWIVDFPSSNTTTKKRRSTSPTTHSPCRRVAWKRWKGRIRSPSRPSSMTRSATASKSPPARSRNQSPELMVKAFEKVGLSQSDVEERFGGLYRAFQYGAPPHGGCAFGIDRVVMLLVGAKNLREITLFPMNQQAQDLLMNAPSPATPTQLRELALRVVPSKKD